ncbi:fatty acid-binding protein DegV [Thermosipho melanesiensis]|uniref:DegV family protein n=2 Tax=Thermosipho melanesiensis TaxID=46541 RepID=A6LJQ9_THEM4|nr:DegV family protein [Thermosipho melanesiensis]ABR30160.1 DegV family protein [Thermosipho melanesiensis BI429]APT73359.1 fatty acid-binding protein DegV [Thermosipho melanesiensis]OOC38174.1 fatty acid-binding protein DegV [Thermosipho melanesiensis]OOC40095.1 fatty acid-binding protein DegV [Thermosipho melanesiensis]OOC40148.1 fatty acid-binding protein DegV [Thermosipho melanesiensis]
MVAFIVDSSFDKPNVETKYPIFLAPLRVYIDGVEYIDKKNLSVDDFYSMLDSAEDFSTSLPNPKETEELVKKLIDEYEHVYMLALSSKLSGTYNMFRAISAPYKDKVTVLDLKTASVELYAIFRGIVHYLEEGKEITQELVDELRKKTKLFFGVMSLKYLEKGGRIGKAKALLGRILKIKPILTVNSEGEVEVVAKERKFTNVVEKLIEIGEEFIESSNLKNPYIIAGYGSEKYRKYLDKVIEHFNIKDVAQISAAVGVHTGPEVFGIVIGQF